MVGRTESVCIPKEVLTVPEIAVYLCVSESIIRRLIREHRIPFNKIEGRYVFFLPAIREWLANNTVRTDGAVNDDAKNRVDRSVEHIWDKVERK